MFLKKNRHNCHGHIYRNAKQRLYRLVRSTVREIVDKIPYRVSAIKVPHSTRWMVPSIFNACIEIIIRFKTYISGFYGPITYLELFFKGRKICTKGINGVHLMI